MIVEKGTRCRVLWGLKALPGEVKDIFKGSYSDGVVARTRYEIELDNGSCVTTTIDAILEP